MKSIKNDTEIKNFIKSHFFRWSSCNKILYWAKNCEKNFTELDAEKKIKFF